MNKYNNNKYNNNKCFMLNKWFNFNYEVKSQIITFRTILRALRKFKIYLSTLNAPTAARPSRRMRARARRHHRARLPSTCARRGLCAWCIRARLVGRRGSPDAGMSNSTVGIAVSMLSVHRRSSEADDRAGKGQRAGARRSPRSGRV